MFIVFINEIWYDRFRGPKKCIQETSTTKIGIRFIVSQLNSKFQLIDWSMQTEQHFQEALITYFKLKRG